MKKIANILILAGGVSKRFWPLGDKQLVRFLGKPLIKHQIDFFSRFAGKLIIVANQDNFQAIRKISQPSSFPVKVVVQTDDFSGMAGAVFSAADYLKGPVLIVNGDDLFDDRLITSLLERINGKTKFLIAAKRMATYFPGGYLKFDRNKKLVGIVEKPSPTELPSSLVRFVGDYFTDVKPLIDFIRTVTTTRDDLYEKALSGLIKKGEVDYAIPDGIWQPIKYPWQVMKAMKYFFKRDLPKITASTPPVFLGKNVRLGKFVKIVGPAYIGDNTIIGDFVLIREANIEANCLIGAHSEIARSYLDQGVMTHRNYVGDSVLGAEVMMGAGAVTANFRFDGGPIKSKVGEKVLKTGLNKFGAIIGQGAKLGVNSTLFPGVKVGKNSFVGPGKAIKRDIDDKQTIL